MCYDGLEELGDATEAAKRAMTDLEMLQNEAKAASNPALMIRVMVSFEEARLVYQTRLDLAMKRLGSAGWNPPPKRVSEGDAEAALRKAGHTLAGELPAKSDLPEVPA